MTADDFPEVPQHVSEAVDDFLAAHTPSLTADERPVVAVKLLRAVAGRSTGDTMTWGDQNAIAIGVTVDLKVDDGIDLSGNTAWAALQAALKALRAEQ